MTPGKDRKKQLQSRFYLDLVGTFLIFLQVAIYIYIMIKHIITG